MEEKEGEIEDWKGRKEILRFGREGRRNRAFKMKERRKERRHLRGCWHKVY